MTRTHHHIASAGKLIPHQFARSRNMVLILLLALIASCAGPVDSPYAAPIAAAPVAHEAALVVESIAKIQTPLANATQSAPKLTPANVNTERPKLVGWLNDAWEAFKTATASANTMKGKAEASDAASAKLFTDSKAKDATIIQLTKENEKNKAFIAKHNDDIWGAKVHRIAKALTFWVLLPFLLIAAAIIALGIVGSLYGVPALTKPVFGSLGGLLDGVRLVLYKLATLIWSVVPLAGHFIDEHLNGVAILKAQVAAMPAPNLAAPVNGPQNGEAK